MLSQQQGLQDLSSRKFVIKIITYVDVDGEGYNHTIVLQEETGVRHIKTWAVMPELIYSTSAWRQDSLLRQLLVGLGVEPDNIISVEETVPALEY